jgi:hypothetical protein
MDLLLHGKFSSLFTEAKHINAIAKLLAGFTKDDFLRRTTSPKEYKDVGHSSLVDNNHSASLQLF